MKNTTVQGELLDYAYLTQIGERRIEHLLEWQWEVFAKQGYVTVTNYVTWFSFE